MISPIANSFREILEDIFFLIFPKFCYACNQALVTGEDMMCSKCLLDLPRVSLHDELEIFNRLNGRIPLQFALSFFKFQKGGKMQQLLHNLKYKNIPTLGVALGRICGQEIQKRDFSPTFDYIIPVPLHPRRFRKRGYNQSYQFAQGLSDILQIPVLDILIRTVPTTTQTRKTKLIRWENVNHVFRLGFDKNLEGHHVLLVDDVMTTGATLEACGAVILSAGSPSLSVATIAWA